jgi:hypothetical protein
MSAGSPLKLFQSGWQGLVGIRRSGAAVLAPAPDALVLADGRSAAVLALAPSPLVLADARSAAVLAPAPSPLVLADARSAAVLALPPFPLVLADARSAAVLAPSPSPLVLADGRSAAVLALAPLPLVLADGRSAAVLAPAPLPLVLAEPLLLPSSLRCTLCVRYPAFAARPLHAAAAACDSTGSQRPTDLAVSAAGRRASLRATQAQGHGSEEQRQSRQVRERRRRDQAPLRQSPYLLCCL